jgi:hypothetical protein
VVVPEFEVELLPLLPPVEVFPPLHPVIEIAATAPRRTSSLVPFHRRRGTNPQKSRAANAVPEGNNHFSNRAEVPAAIVETVRVVDKGEPAATLP